MIYPAGRMDEYHLDIDGLFDFREFYAYLLVPLCREWGLTGWFQPS